MEFLILVKTPSRDQLTARSPPTQRNPDQLWEDARSWNTFPWQDADRVHYFTDRHTLSKAEPSEHISYFREEAIDDQTTADVERPISSARFEFPCNGTIASLPSNRIDFAAKYLFRSDDFLFPADDVVEPSQDGNTYVDMVYIRRKSLLLSEGLRFNYSEWCNIQKWELSRNPLVQFTKGGHLKYRSAPDLWFHIIVPHEVVIPDDAVWTYGLVRNHVELEPVVVFHPTTKEILEDLFPP
jgi:hypothetical protein